MKKYTILFLSLLLCNFVCAQQNAFINSEKNKIDLSEDKKVSFSIDDLEAWTVENIAEQVTSETEWIDIKFYCDPEFSDEEKKGCTKDVLTKLQKLELVKSICQPKVFSFTIGEFIFMNQKETNATRKNWDKMVNMNLTNAWKEMSKGLVQMFPHATFYAEVAGW